MRGSIQKKGNNYYAVVSIGSKRKWIKAGKTLKGAQQILNENVMEVQEGRFRDTKKMTFKEFADIWVESHVKSKIKETCWPEYLCIVRLLTNHFGDALLQNLTGAHIQTFVSKRLKEVQPASAHLEIVLLKQMLKDAYHWGYVKRNPAEFVKNPRVPKKRVSILEIDEAYKLVEKIHPHFRVAMLTAILTGLRANELWGLTWEDADLENNVIHVRHSLWRGKLFSPKTEGSARKVDIPPSLSLELKKQKLQSPKNDMNLVFLTRQGRPVIHDNFCKYFFKPALKDAGLQPVKFHALRHGNASLRIRGEQNPKYLSEQLGHASIKFTFDMYGHLFNDAEFARSQVAKLENVFYGR